MIRGGLFSQYFLQEGVRDLDGYRALDDARVADAEARLRTLWAALAGFRRPSEAETEAVFILPALALLGWHQLPQQEPGRGRRDLADALLFLSPADLAQASRLPSDVRFRLGVVVTEHEARETRLDRATGGGEAPSNQILRYLKRADGIANSRVRAGILTNGRVWRLYWSAARARDQDILEIDLAGLLETPPPVPEGAAGDHWLRVFLLLFGRDALAPLDAAGTTPLDRALAEGRRFEQRITESLSRAVFDTAFPDLVAALAASDAERDPQSAAYRADLKEAALILLFRLLFVLYAEARLLLPADHAGYRDYSLRRLQDDAARAIDDGREPSARARSWWPRITTLFAAIANGNPDLGLPAYNGGLFDDAQHPLLARVSLDDAALVRIVDALSRAGLDGARRAINYRDLSVQQLGAIYEVLLARELVADGPDVGVRPDDTLRHGIGAFYTSDALVSLILVHAVVPQLEERRAAFRARAETLLADPRPLAQRRAELVQADPAESFLRLKVCDPAMGSGHFLVALVDLLATETLAAMADAADTPGWPGYRSPLAAELEAVRAKIAAEAAEQGWPVREEQLDDKALIRRIVLKRVVYGVDSNKLAVELAKLALWLHSFTVGAPLSFLDHHLRHGDSVMGETVGRVRANLAEEYGLALSVGDALGASRGMQQIEALLDTDLSEAKASQSLFAEVEAITAPLRGLLDLVHARRWIAPTRGDKATAEGLRAFFARAYGEPLAIVAGSPPQGPPPESPTQAARLRRERKPLPTEAFAAFAAWLEQARSLIADLHPLHWQPAFPGLWREWAGADPPGGFDAVIGNPPYVRQEAIKAMKPALAGLYAAYDGTADLYVYFYERGLSLLRPGGRLSYVVTNKWLKAGYAEELRTLLGERAWVEAVFDFGHAKAMFPDADVMPCVLVARRPDPAVPVPAATQVSVIARDDVDLARLDAQVAAAAFDLPRARFGRDEWLLLPQDELALFDRLRERHPPLHVYSDATMRRGVLTGLNEAFVIDQATRDRLVAEDPRSAEFIKPFLRGEDIDRWVSDWDAQWMIFTRRGTDIDSLPAIKAHLLQFQAQLEPRPADWKPTPSQRTWPGRKPGSYRWWEIQDNVAYYADFDRPKIVWQEIQWFPAYCIDRQGLFGNNKVYFLPADDPWLLACLNSPILWWFNWRVLVHVKDEGLTPQGYKMEQVPIAAPGARADSAAAHVEALCAIQAEAHAARRALAAWYRVAWELERIPAALKDPFGLDAEEFAAALKNALPPRRRLGVADVQRIQAQHRDHVAPVALRLAEARRHEQALSDLVLDAYELSAEDRALMWRTAPPRMPATAS